MEHTKGPWEYILSGENDGRFKVHNGDTLIAKTNANEANARRIVDCVNACEGINPRAVPELLEATDRLLEQLNALWDWLKDRGGEYGDMIDDMDFAEQAIANARNDK